MSSKLFKNVRKKLTEEFMTNQIDTPKLSAWLRNSTFKIVRTKEQPVHPERYWTVKTEWSTHTVQKTNISKNYGVYYVKYNNIHV